MYPELYLYVERARASELRAEARRQARARRSRGGVEARVRALEARLGWVLVETGLRLVHRYH
ncbi:hypothetical protein ACIBQ1_14610 [Nonomuraea sp. NPDC050153]|uniref:hypothetical protein n=1 Tax=Nonomuraea sp. NPDC050153 TaxID=3364359 RepID=UPI0037AD378A